MRRLYIVSGLLSNSRGLLAEGIRSGQAHGFDVRILDAVNLVPIWRAYPNPWDALGLTDRVTRWQEASDLDDFCEDYRSARRPSAPRDLVLFLNPPGVENRWIWKALHEAGYLVGVMTLSPVPMIEDRSALRRLLDSLFFKPLRRIKAMTKPVPAFWIISGARTVACYRSFFRHIRGTLMIKAHSADYQAFHCDNAEPGTGTPGEYILFLDQGWHTKLDASIRPDGKYPPTREATYREAVVPWLKQLEADTGLPVIISAHPKAGLERTQEIYPGLTVSEQPTRDLVRNARVVIGNCSTSLQFAVMANKPIWLFTSDELDRSIMLPGVRGYQQMLNVPVVNIDHPAPTTQLMNALDIDRQKYDRYLNDYVVQPDSGEGGLWEKIFAQLVRLG